MLGGRKSIINININVLIRLERTGDLFAAMFNGIFGGASFMVAAKTFRRELGCPCKGLIEGQMNERKSKEQKMRMKPGSQQMKR